MAKNRNAARVLANSVWKSQSVKNCRIQILHELRDDSGVRMEDKAKVMAEKVSEEGDIKEKVGAGTAEGWGH